MVSSRRLVSPLAVMPNVSSQQVILVCLNFTLATVIIAMTLPFALVALVALFLAIYCRWKACHPTLSTLNPKP